MKKAIIVYFTQTGVTKQLVGACKKGLESCVEVKTHQILGKEIIEGRFSNQKLFEALLECDAIIFATPTYIWVRSQLNSKHLQMLQVSIGENKNGQINWLQELHVGQQ
jgi:flavodoxin